MTKEQIIQAVDAAVAERGCFLVEVSVSAVNDIEIIIEKEEGVVDWDDCAAIDRVMHEAFDQDVEDYSLTVSSAGLDQPFKVPAQFRKALGSQVEVLLKGGRKLAGILTDAGEEGITLRYTTRELPEGKKRKVTVEREEMFGFELVNSVTPKVEFK